MARARLVVALLALALALPACGLLGRGRGGSPAPVDLNRASLKTVAQLPGVTPSMARRIVDGRPYRDAHELVGRGILTARELERIDDRIVVKGHEP